MAVVEFWLKFWLLWLQYKEEATISPWGIHCINLGCELFRNNVEQLMIPRICKKNGHGRIFSELGVSSVTRFLIKNVSPSLTSLFAGNDSLSAWNIEKPKDTREFNRPQRSEISRRPSLLFQLFFPFKYPIRILSSTFPSRMYHAKRSTSSTHFHHICRHEMSKFTQQIVSEQNCISGVCRAVRISSTRLSGKSHFLISTRALSVAVSARRCEIN